MKDARLRKEIIQYGFKYVLVNVESRKNYKLDDPKFMGYPGFALQSVTKIKKVKS